MSNAQKPAMAQSTNQPVNSVENESADQFDISESSYKTGHAAVRKARRFAMQGLYEWLMTDHRFEKEGQREWKANPPHDIAARTRANNAMHTVHLGYYHAMMREIPEQIEDLNELIAEHLDRDISLLDPIEHAILLIGTYELKDHIEVPYKVVLDEAMKLNTHFGATDAHKLINAVLDKLAPQLRPIEVAADAQPKATKKVKTKSEKTASIESNKTDSLNEQNLNENSTEATTENSAHYKEDATLKTESKPRIGLKSGNLTRQRTASVESLPKASLKITPPNNPETETLKPTASSNND